MKKFTKRTLACAVAAALMAPMSAFATNGYFAHGYSTKSNGMVGAGVALPEDAMAAATNPAGMVWVGQTGDVGAAIFSPHRSYTAGNPGPGASFAVAPGTVDSDTNYFLIPHFGMNWMIDPQSSVGISVYGNGGMNTDYPASAPCLQPGGTGTYCAGSTGVDLMQLFVNGSYSRKINATSSWGVSVIAAYQRFKAKGLAAFNSFNLSSSPSNLTNNGYDNSTGFGAKIGWQGQVATGLTLGASYQSKMSMSKFGKYKGLFADGGSFDIPATATIGLAYDTTPSSKLAFDIQKIFYSDVDSIANPMMPNLANCMGGNTSQCLGGSNGAGFGWQDMTVYKLGYQWATSPAWTWRVGYSYGKQPIPSSEVLFNMLAPAVMEQHFTFGFTNKLSPTSDWSFAAMYAPEKKVSGTNPLGDGQTIDLKMHQFQVEASYSWKF